MSSVTKLQSEIAKYKSELNSLESQGATGGEEHALAGAAMIDMHRIYNLDINSLAKGTPAEQLAKGTPAKAEEYRDYNRKWDLNGLNEKHRSIQRTVKALENKLQHAQLLESQRMKKTLV